MIMPEALPQENRTPYGGPQDKASLVRALKYDRKEYVESLSRYERTLARYVKPDNKWMAIDGQLHCSYQQTMIDRAVKIIAYIDEQLRRLEDR